MITDYIKLIRFRYHVTFVLVVAGAFMGNTKSLVPLIATLAIVYVSFNVLLYGALYTLNDIADVKKDALHPQKKYRPLPSGKISKGSALVFAIICIALALLIAYYYFGLGIFCIYLAFIFVNQIYTRIAKKIPYLEIIVNAITHPMRFWLGLMVTGAALPYLVLGGIFFLSMGFACIRRIIEFEAPGAATRAVLAHYSLKKLLWLQIISFMGMIILFIINYPYDYAWYVAMLLAYVVLVFGIYYSKPIRNFYRKTWLR